MALLGERRDLLRRRYATGARGTDGRWVRGASADIPFTASVQNLQGKQREVMTEGTRQSEYRMAYIEERGFLRTEDDKASPKIEADEVVDCATGEVYKVVSAVNDSGLLTHQACSLFRLREGPR